MLVDTSVWADFLNGHQSAHATALAGLLAGEGEPCTCGVIVTEVFQGLRHPRSRWQIQRFIRELDFLEPPGIDTYLRAADVYRLLREQGHTIRSTQDCIIAAIAEAHGCQILARDRDMDAIVASGVLAIRPWPLPARPR